MEDQEGGEVMGDENQSWFYFHFLLVTAIVPKVPFIYSFIQVISRSHSYCYHLTAFNRIHALLLSLEIIHKRIGLVEDVLSVGGMHVKQK